MDSLPITGLEELQNHLQRLVEDPETPLEAKLFDEVELQLNGKLPTFEEPSNWRRETEAR